MVTKHELSRRRMLTGSLMVGLGAAVARVPKIQAAQGEPITLTFVTSATQDSTEIVAITELFRAFEEANPNITIELQPIPYESFMETLTTRVIGGEAPDAGLLLDRFATAMVGQQALLPLDDYLPSDYSEAFIEATWTFAVADGRPYAIPLYTNVQAILYNADHFDVGGIEVPATPHEAWLFGEVVDVAETAKSANETEYGLIHWPASTPSRLSQYLVAEGGAVLNEDLTAPALDSPEAIDLLTRIQATFASGLAPQDNWTTSDAMFPLWADGQASMLLGSGNFQIHEASELVGDAFSWSFAFMPTTLGTPIELVAFEQTEHPEETVALLQFLAEPESMAYVASQAIVVPTRTDIPSGELSYETGDEQMRILQDQATVASERIQREMKHPAWSEIDLMLRAKLEQLALGQIEPAQLVDEGSTEIERLLERYERNAN